MSAQNASQGVDLSVESNLFDFLIRNDQGDNSLTRYSWLTTNQPTPHDVQTFGNGFDFEDANSPDAGFVTRVDIDALNDGNTDVRITQITGVLGSDNVSPARLAVITDNAAAFHREIFSFSDSMTGSAFDDILSSGGGADLLIGGGGADVLFGDSGNDVLRGGAGADRLRGSTGADFYDYNSVTESRGTSTDLIIGFLNPGNMDGDRIDLNDIDAIPGAANPGNQAFTFRNVIAEGVLTPAGSVYVRASGSNTLLLANTDGDAAAEFGVRIDDNNVTPSQYSAQDLIL